MGRPKKITAIEKVDVLPAVKMTDGMNDAVPESLETAHERAGKELTTMLADVDAKAKQAGLQSNLAEQWSTIKAFKDVNELVRHNVHQMQVVMQEQMAYFLEHKNRVEKELDELLEQAMSEPATMELFMSQRDKLNTERNNLIMGLGSTSRTIAALAKEYRQCALGRKFFVHIASVEQFSVIVRGLIQKYIQDPVALGKVANELRGAVKDCFPANQEDE